MFEDLGESLAEEALTKAELASGIAGIIACRKLAQAAAGENLNVDQPKVSHVLAQAGDEL